jgi:lantibiotic modifying enzyme
VRFVGVLPTDLLSGRAGLGLVLAHLARATRSSRFRDAARAALATVPAAFETPGLLGGYCGLGGVIYALARAAVLLDDGWLAERARMLVGMCPRRALATGPWDVVTGLSGFLLGALALGERPRDVAGALRAAWDRGLTPAPCLDGGLPRAAPDQETGVAYTLWRLGPALGEDPVPPRFAATGHLLWRLGVDAAAPAEATRRLAASSSDLLGDLDLALSAHDATGDPAFLAVARARAEEILDGRGRVGRWFPETRVAETHDLSAVTGLAGLAHALLRLQAPREVRSLRRME